MSKHYKNRRPLWIIVALVMLVATIAPMPALAGGNVPSPEQQAAEALHSIGLVMGYGNGADGKPVFGLDESMNRVFGAVMFLRLVGEYDAAEASAYDQPFSDVPVWADKYIAYAYAKGYTSGVSASRFDPEGEMTATMFLSLALKALGYEMGVDFQWDSAWTLTDKLGVTNGKFNAANNSLTRGDMMLISLMTLEQFFKGSPRTLIESLTDAGVVPWNAAKTIAEEVRSITGSGFMPTVRAGTLVVGDYGIGGNFLNDFTFTNGDLSIQTLICGYYETYSQTADGRIMLNPAVVSNVQTSVDSAGNKTYTFTIHNDLKWSDGSALTAEDYVASVLLYASPELASDGSFFSTAGDALSGYGEYNIGDTAILKGIRLIDTYRFSATIASEVLPNFYETAYVAFSPVPLSVWLPGVSISSDAGGSRFDREIASHIQRITETELHGPSVSCGPYKFVNYDGTSVHLEKNRYFKGDRYGRQPIFNDVIVKEIDYSSDAGMIAKGEIDLIPYTIEPSLLDSVKSNPGTAIHSFRRAGYGQIAFQVDRGPVADANVRWAIAHIIDRDVFVDQVLGGYGGTVDANYCVAQWTYQARRSQLDTKLKPITFNIDLANDLLDQTEWKYEADGATPFDRTKASAGGTYMRYNSKGEMLVIHHLSASPPVGAVVENEITKKGPLVGLKYEVTQSDWSELYEHYYYSSDLGPNRYYHAFNLADNFSAFDDKTVSWHSDNADDWWNPNNLRDDEIDRITSEMKRLDPAETEKYADLWVEFQVRWQQLLPSIPIYVNEYYDVYSTSISYVPTSPFAQWADFICQIHLK